MGAHYEALCRYLVFSGLYAVLACALHTPQTLHHQASSQVQLRRVHVICSGPSLNVGSWDAATFAVWLALLPKVPPGKCHSTWCPLSGSRCCGQHGVCSKCVHTFPSEDMSQFLVCTRQADGWQVVLVSPPSYALDAANLQPHQQPAVLTGLHHRTGQPGPSVHPHPTLVPGHCLLTLMSRYTTSLECKYSRADTISAP